MAVGWVDEVDEVLGGDLVATLAYATPAHGVVLTPMAPLGLRDRDAGTITLNTPVALPAKLLALRRDPVVAVAFHAREHGRSTSPDFVLVQGRATVGEVDPAWMRSLTPEWERDMGPHPRGLAGRLLADYHWQRAPITVAVERIVVLRGPGHRTATVLGAPVPDTPPAPQPPPRRGTGPRVRVARTARHVRRLPHTQLGWIGADGLPVVVPVTDATPSSAGLLLTTPARDLLPPGGRRAGLLSHAFGPRIEREEIRRGTGWLEVGEGAVRYAPHTATGLAVPAFRPVFVLGVAVTMRRGMRRARELGLAGPGDGR